MKKFKGFGTPPEQRVVVQNLARAQNLLLSGQLPQAEDLYLKILQAHPDHPEGLYFLGMTLHRLGQLDIGIQLMLKALTLQPEARWHYNLGVVLHHQGELTAALSQYQAALRLQPNFAEGHTSLAGVLLVQGKLTEAIAHYRQALALQPTLTMAHDNLLLTLQYLPNLSTEVWRTALQDFAKACATLPRQTSYPNPTDPERRLRVGYVSADLYTHSCAWFVEPLLASHNPQQVEIFVYAQVAQPDRMTAHLQSLTHHWCSILGWTDAAVAQRIQLDAIDLLVDLGGHTAFNRLPVFARKPAPLQLTWLGFPGSTGLDAVDYRLSDPWLTEPGTPEYFSETVWNLPRVAHCYGPPEEAPPVAPLPCLEKGYLTFGSFNNLIKATPETLALWARVLKAVPDSSLLLKCWQFANLGIQQRLVTDLGRLGIPPERLEFIGHVPTTTGHLSYYHYVDIALDTFPYNGTTTTLEALWMGVPVVSLVGDRTAARVGGSFLKVLGLPELATATADEFVAATTALAFDQNRLEELRQGLRARMQASPLTDRADFAQAMEGAYRKMWRNWCAQSQGV